MNALVLVETAAVSSCVVTVLTFVRLHPSMRPHVHLQLILATETFVANITLMGLVSCVCSQMTFHVLHTIGSLELATWIPAVQFLLCKRGS